MTAFLTAWQPHLLSLLRCMAGLLLMQHGCVKLLSFPVPYANPLPVFGLLWIGGVIELGCGLLLALGLFTRPAAFLASGFTAVAYFMAHAPRSFYPIVNSGELAVLYSFVFLYLAVAGAGPISLDAKRGAA